MMVRAAVTMGRRIQPRLLSVCECSWTNNNTHDDLDSETDLEIMNDDGRRQQSETVVRG